MSRRARTPLADPDRLTAEGEAFRRELEQQATADLERHPQRHRYAKAGDRDEYRAKPQRGDHDAPIRNERTTT